MRMTDLTVQEQIAQAIELGCDEAAHVNTKYGVTCEPCKNAARIARTAREFKPAMPADTGLRDALMALADDLQAVHDRVCTKTDESIPFAQRNPHDCAITRTDVVERLRAVLAAHPAPTVPADTGLREALDALRAQHESGHPEYPTISVLELRAVLAAHPAPTVTNARSFDSLGLEEHWFPGWDESFIKTDDLRAALTED